MKFPAFHLLVWIFLYQHLSTCHGPVARLTDENHYSYGHGRSFFYYNQDDRLQILREFKQAIRARYALLDIKRQRLGVDAALVFDQALEREAAMLDVHDPSAQAQSNLEFMDRLKAIAAIFQDSHLQLKELVPLPDVYLGLKTRWVEGHIIITSMENRLEEIWRHQKISIEIGDQIIAIDGKPVDEWLEILQDYIPGSSKAYRQELAAEALTKRSFYYPERATSHLRIRSANDKYERDVNLTWYTNAETIRPDAALFLVNRGIQFRVEESYIGVNIYDAPLNLEASEEWFSADAPDQLVYRLGYIRKPGKKPVGVLQVFSFYSLEIIQSDGEMLDTWEAPLVRFVKELNEEKTELILDIRWNEGGHTFLAENLVRILMPIEVSYASYTEAFRITPSIRQMWQGQDFKVDSSYSDSQAVRYVNEATMNARDHTYVWAHSEPLEAHPEVGGFEQGLIVLVSPSCLSSCELLAMLLQQHKRATLLGSETNGTGAGYFEWEPFSGGRWTDSYEVITVDIPNYLIGRPGQAGKMLYPSPTAYIEFNKENQPIVADIPYRETQQDVLRAGTGWFEAAILRLRDEYHEQSH
ncbi:MAG: S41 family peptidase [Oligoflexus sp.]